MRKRVTIPIKKYLPHNFETWQRVKKIRATLIKGVNSKKSEALGLAKECKKGKRCLSGLCPVCQRLLRCKLLRFAHQQKWSKLKWCLITIRSDAWKMAQGDCQRFTGMQGIDKITDIDRMSVFLQRLQRRYKLLQSTIASEYETFDHDRLLIIGSVETVWNMVANKPAGKPFHIHLMISGLSEDEIAEEMAKSFAGITCKPTSALPKPTHIEPVKNTRQDFKKSLTYVVKQPYWKRSRVDVNDRSKGKPQSLTSGQLAELASNYGPLKVTGRLIKIGIEYRGGKFKLSPLKSKS